MIVVVVSIPTAQHSLSLRALASASYCKPATFGQQAALATHGGARALAGGALPSAGGPAL